jgi:hypothetical protein
MEDRLLLGLRKCLVPIPSRIWLRVLNAEAGRSTDRLAFMSSDHNRVRDYCVVELARTGAPLAPETIAAALDLDLGRVNGILDELEENKTFIFRSQGESVTWAYPVTVDHTPHHVTFNTGETVYAA